MKKEEIQKIRLSVDCPHCGHLLFLEMSKGEDTLDTEQTKGVE